MFCPRHPEQPVIGTCSRSGTFVCTLDSRIIDGQLFCESCAGRTDVDWLEGFRLKHWGKREGWAWLFGVGAPVQLAMGIMMAFDNGSRPLAPFVFASAVGGAMWWLKRPAARWLLAATMVAQGLYLSVTIHPLSILGSIFPLLILFSISTATTTKLFFELPVTRDELRRMWDLHANNQVARHALSLGIASLIIWPFAPIAVLLGAIGLMRVDLAARPPIGRKKSAIAGIVLGFLGAAIGTAMVVTGNFR